MSIIEETLRALQRKQEKKSSDNKTADPDNYNNDHEPGNEKKPILGKYRTFITIIIVLTLMAFAGFFWMDVYQKNQRKKSARYQHQEPLLFTEVKIPDPNAAPEPEIKTENNHFKRKHYLLIVGLTLWIALRNVAWHHES